MPGTKCLKLKYYKLLSNVAFNFNLRRYSEGTTLWAVSVGSNYINLMCVAVDGENAVVAAGSYTAEGFGGYISTSATFGGITLGSAGGGDAVLWKLSAEGTTLWAVRGGGTSYDRLQAVAVDSANAVAAVVKFSSSPATFGGLVGRCRLTVSKPVLKARLVSALETEM